MFGEGIVAIKFKFDMEKTAESINYLAKQVSYPTIMAIAKLLYFADKTSLERFGRSITGDAYFAMQHGPVPSQAYNMMKSARDSDVYGFTIEYSKQVKPTRNPNLIKLSRSDIECLTDTAKQYGNYPVWQLRQLSHDEAWRAAWARSGNAGSVLMSLEEVISSVDDDEGDLMEYLLETNKPENERDM